MPAYALVAGVPARVVGWACRCGARLRFDAVAGVCEACGRRYRKENGRVTLEQEA